MMISLGFPADRVSMTLDTVDNDWWLAQANAADETKFAANRSTSRPTKK